MSFSTFLIGISIVIIPAFLIEFAGNKYLQIKKELIDYENQLKSRKNDN